MSPGYDDWLEAPYQRMYVLNPQREELDELIGETVQVDEDLYSIEDYQVVTDEDEDGKHDEAVFELCRRYVGLDGEFHRSTIYRSENEVRDAIRAHIEHLASAPGPTHKERERLEAILKRT